MSAFGTKKPMGDRGVQLTFPLNFQQAYDLPLEYFPSMSGSGYDVMIGTDFQSEYHQQKRAEANKRVMDGIQANRTKEHKLLTGVHNYHLPKPVLGQRIYANPMNGADNLVSTRRDNGKVAPFRVIEAGAEGGMRGGVVRTLEAQEFYKNQLNRRIAQLNRMNATAQGFAVQMGNEYKTEDNTKTGSADKIEYFIYLKALANAITEGDLSSFSFENLKKLVELLVSAGPTMTDEDFEDSLKELDLMINSAQFLTDIPDIRDADRRRQSYATTITIYCIRMRQYITAMYSGDKKVLTEEQVVRQAEDRDKGIYYAQPTPYYRSEKEKRALSKALRKELFEKLIKSKEVVGLVEELRRNNPRVNQEAENYDDEDGGDGEFDRPAVNREDEEAGGMQRQPFAGRNADENRERFGRRTGVFTFGAPTWFGEAEAVRADEELDLAPRYVAPLTLAGADPNAERAPRANPQIIREAVEDQVYRVLEPLGYTRDEDEGDFIHRYYSVPNDFVKEVSQGLEERGFSKAQIAEGMTLVGLDVFEEYIAEFGEDTAPKPITSANRTNVMAMGGLGPPIYRDDDEDGEADVVPASQLASSSTTTTTNIKPSVAEALKRKEQRKEEEKAKSSAERKAILKRAGLPESRDEMYKKYISEADYRALGMKIPAEYGGPYIMRSGTAVKNAKHYIIKLIKENIDADF